jgi:hypothetical protein
MHADSTQPTLIMLRLPHIMHFAEVLLQHILNMWMLQWLMVLSNHSYLTHITNLMYNRLDH